MHNENQDLYGKAINIGTGIDIDIKTIAEKILNRMNKPLDLIGYVNDRPGQVEKHVASTERAKELLNWESETDFDSGLDLTIDWYASNQRWWEPIRWMRQIPIKMKDGTVVMH